MKDIQPFDMWKPSNKSLFCKSLYIVNISPQKLFRPKTPYDTARANQ